MQYANGKITNELSGCSFCPTTPPYEYDKLECVCVKHAGWPRYRGSPGTLRCPLDDTRLCMSCARHHFEVYHLRLYSRAVRSFVRRVRPRRERPTWTLCKCGDHHLPPVRRPPVGPALNHPLLGQPWVKVNVRVACAICYHLIEVKELIVFDARWYAQASLTVQESRCESCTLHYMAHRRPVTTGPASSLGCHEYKLFPPQHSLRFCLTKATDPIQPIYKLDQFPVQELLFLLGEVSPDEQNKRVAYARRIGYPHAKQTQSGFKRGNDRYIKSLIHFDPLAANLKLSPRLWAQWRQEIWSHCMSNPDSPLQGTSLLRQLSKHSYPQEVVLISFFPVGIRALIYDYFHAVHAFRTALQAVHTEVRQRR